MLEVCDHVLVGYHSALFFQERGLSKVTAIAERDGYIVNENGLDIPKLKEYFDTNGSILGFPAAESFVSGLLMAHFLIRHLERRWKSRP